jgi:superfamily II DNA/RNA helicase
MSGSFEALGLGPALVAALAKEGITEPTEIQQKAIPLDLEGRDIVARAETGTGKTLAYLLPLYQRLAGEPQEMRAIVLTPTHELAIQIQRQCERLKLNSGLSVTSTPLIGGVNIVRQIDKLKKRPQILIGSPGRILELIDKKYIAAKNIRTVVLDEADRLLDVQYRDGVTDVISRTPAGRQLLFYSASIPQAIEEHARKLAKKPEIIRAEGGMSIPESIGHICFTVELRDKVETLRKALNVLKPVKALIFVNQDARIEDVTEKLRYHGFKADCIHGAKDKFDRKRIMDDYRKGKLRFLVASDMAARGLHMEGITHVFHLDVPEDPKYYLHRAGRTGRNGSEGLSVVIAAPFELPLLRAIEKAFRIGIRSMELRGGEIRDSDIQL